jgi:hypothetical protein
MNYSTMTIAQLKAEIDKRNSTAEKPYNSKTRKGDLIVWLEEDDASAALLEAQRVARNQTDADAQRGAFRSAPVVRKTNTERLIQYYIQNGTEKLTARQSRAVRKAANREIARMEAS